MKGATDWFLKPSQLWQLYQREGCNRSVTYPNDIASPTRRHFYDQGILSTHVSYILALWKSTQRCQYEHFIFFCANYDVGSWYSEMAAPVEHCSCHKCNHVENIKQHTSESLLLKRLLDQKFLAHCMNCSWWRLHFWAVNGQISKTDCTYIYIDVSTVDCSNHKEVLIISISFLCSCAWFPSENNIPTFYVKWWKWLEFCTG